MGIQMNRKRMTKTFGFQIEKKIVLHGLCKGISVL